jgi:hypothetical protein
LPRAYEEAVARVVATRMLIPLALALLVPALQSSTRAAADEVSALRAEGPPALDRLLARYDALPTGAEKEALEHTIDAVAKQRYATVSRLYWYTDLAAAEAAAQVSRRPILSLRMLGRLDEELSCANSRLFRVVLYADAELSRFLRDSFVLHWSSERPVPRVTIDFGDGRKIETTLAGNSAHFVLDAAGRPLDVLPGLYGARAFRRELEAVLPLAREAAELDERELAQRLADFHAQRLVASRELWAASGAPTHVAFKSGASIGAAERTTVSKAAIEMPLVRAGAWRDAPLRGALAPAGELPRDLAVRRLDDARLGASSRALVEHLSPTDWSLDASPLHGQDFDDLVRALEVLVGADTELDETRLHARVHAWFTARTSVPTFAVLDERVYRELFAMSADDVWLGLSHPGIFSALPHDGIVR